MQPFALIRHSCNKYCQLSFSYEILYYEAELQLPSTLTNTRGFAEQHSGLKKWVVNSLTSGGHRSQLAEIF